MMGKDGRSINGIKRKTPGMRVSTKGTTVRLGMARRKPVVHKSKGSGGSALGRGGMPR